MKYKQIESLDEVMKLMMEGTIIYWSTRTNIKDAYEDECWFCRYATFALPDNPNERTLLRNYYHSLRWGSFDYIPFDQLRGGLWFIDKE